MKQRLAFRAILTMAAFSALMVAPVMAQYATGTAPQFAVPQNPQYNPQNNTAPQQGYVVPQPAVPQQPYVPPQQNPQQYQQPQVQTQYAPQPQIPQQSAQPQYAAQGQYPQQGQNYVNAPAQQPYAAAAPSITPPAHPALTGAAAKNPNHPLVPIIEWAKAERPRVQAIKDFTFTLIKQESVNGKMFDPCAFDMKIRNEPFSVYLKYRQPVKKAGTEAIFVKGQNKDKILAKGVGIQGLVGTTSLSPDSRFAMEGNKYPITEVGIARLVDLFIEVGENDILNNHECTVQYYENAKVGPRTCTCIQVIHPKPTPGKFPFHIAKIFIDDELQLPIRYESYDWPKSEGEEPMLLEAYIYSDLKINVGLTDVDFDTKNPTYRF